MDAEAGDGGGTGTELADAELGDIILHFSAKVDAWRQTHELLLGQVSFFKNYLDGIIRSSTDGIVAIDPERRILTWNPAADILFDILGIPPEKPAGRPILEIMRGPCRDFARMLVRSLEENRGFAAVETRLVDQSGRQRYFSLSASPIRGQDENGSGRIVGAVQIFSDLTGFRELEERANRQDRLAALGEMAAGVAHEIRNPLGGIELYASSLRRKFAGDSPEYATCGKIIAAAASLNRIVGDMLTFTRSRPVQSRKARAGQVLRSALDLAARELEARGVAARLELPDPDPPRLWDPEQIVQASLNVILNAAQAMPPGGVVTITAGPLPPGSDFGIRFADQGSGIPDPAKTRIFDPFFTLRKDGTGLGLAIVHKIIQEHGGSVEVSDNQPRGTVITFRLPGNQVPDPGEREGGGV
ncbi:MAG: PAS domain-containing protein, partial [Planctomycetota bacterium]|nr:PAS domain-containing protein [Planctomycetota bacterium]